VSGKFQRWVKTVGAELVSRLPDHEWRYIIFALAKPVTPCAVLGTAESLLGEWRAGRHHVIAGASCF